MIVAFLATVLAAGASLIFVSPWILSWGMTAFSREQRVGGGIALSLSGLAFFGPLLKNVFDRSKRAFLWIVPSIGFSAFGATFLEMPFLASVPSFVVPFFFVRERNRACRADNASGQPASRT